MSRTQEIVKELEALSLGIKTSLENINAERNALDKSQSLLKRQEMSLLKQVLQAQDNDGKALYKNETQRGMAHQKLKDHDEMYGKYLMTTENHQVRLKEMETEFDWRKYQHRTKMKIADLTMAEMMSSAKAQIIVKSYPDLLEFSKCIGGN